MGRIEVTAVTNLGWETGLVYRFWMAAVVAALAAPADSQAPTPRPVLTYADLADVALAAPVVAHVRVADSERLSAAQAPGLAAGRSRFFIQADVVSLIRGAQGLPQRVRYLADLPNEGGRPPRLAKKREFLIMAAPVAGRLGELRLVGPDAQPPYNRAEADRLRAILQEAIRPEAAPAIIGIGKAFHVPGSLPGESETQIFLQGADQRPLSLNILRRPGEVPSWSVALSEIVDEAAGAPRRDTLLWYRLACTLPARLPQQSLAEADPEQARAIEADYRLVMQQLGPCARTRPRR